MRPLRVSCDRVQRVHGDLGLVKRKRNFKLQASSFKLNTSAGSLVDIISIDYFRVVLYSLPSLDVRDFDSRVSLHQVNRESQ